MRQSSVNENRIQRLRYSRLIAGLAALALVIGASWIALEYFVPSPPFRVTIATGRKGTTFDYSPKDIEHDSPARELSSISGRPLAR